MDLLSRGDAAPLLMFDLAHVSSIRSHVRDNDIVVPYCRPAWTPVVAIIELENMSPSTRRQHVIRFSASMFIAVVALSVVMRSPRFEMFHTVDVVLLLFGGAAFGVGLANLFAIFRA
jgi:hypothetical protein